MNLSKVNYKLRDFEGLYEYLHNSDGEFVEDLKKGLDALESANLSVMYANGIRGVSANHKKAVELLEKSVEQGNLQALTNLGLMYLDGKGVQQDSKKGAELIKKSANHGVPEGQYTLKNSGKIWNY
jgi:TPR repeat protein